MKWCSILLVTDGRKIRYFISDQDLITPLSAVLSLRPHIIYNCIYDIHGFLFIPFSGLNFVIVSAVEQPSIRKRPETSLPWEMIDSPCNSLCVARISGFAKHVQLLCSAHWVWVCDCDPAFVCQVRTRILPRGRPQRSWSHMTPEPVSDPYSLIYASGLFFCFFIE